MVSAVKTEPNCLSDWLFYEEDEIGRYSRDNVKQAANTTLKSGAVLQKMPLATLLNLRVLLVPRMQRLALWSTTLQRVQLRARMLSCRVMPALSRNTCSGKLVQLNHKRPPRWQALQHWA